jgi:site-specific recombinase XerD
MYGCIETTDIPNIKDNMVNFLEERSKFGKLAAKTKQSYKEWLNPFLYYCCQHYLPIEDKSAAESYINLLIGKQRDLTYVRNLKRLLENIFNYKLKSVTCRDLCDEIRTDEELVLGQKKLLLIIDWAETNIDKHYELCIFILLIFYTAARPSEVLSLTMRHIYELRFKSETSIVGKGQKKRVIVTASTSMHNRIYDCILKRCIDKERKILTFSLRYLRQKFKHLQEKELLFDGPYPSPHSLRRASGRCLLPETDLFVIMDRLGHTNLSTTQRYLRCNRESLKTAATNAELKRLALKI